MIPKPTVHLLAAVDRASEEIDEWLYDSLSRRVHLAKKCGALTFL